MSSALDRARRYEAEREADIAEADRPAFHLSPRVGWMNDPNGLSLYGGKYHLFYQYHPYDSHWGPMHWGHAVSADLLRWEYLPAALAPDMPYDQAGCFSGCAVVLPDGRHALMYTGVREEAGPDGQKRSYQTQCLAFGDGVNYEKYAGNPVLGADDLPEGASPHDFRDPRLLPAPGGGWRALLASDRLSPEGARLGGQVLLYESADLKTWRLKSVPAQNPGRLGTMWECPDLFRLDGGDVMLISAQDMLPEGLEYHNGNGTFCLLGHMDPETGAFVEESDHAVDYGIDFYAPQTILTPDGRRVMIGWMQNWDTCALPLDRAPWFGQMSLPRELFLKDGRLWQRPLRELEGLRGAEVRHEAVLVENGEIALPGVEGRMLDLELTVEPEGEVYTRFALIFAQDDAHRTALGYRPRESILKIDRKFSGSRRAIIHQRRAQVRADGGRLRLRLILDRFSAEAFVNGGEQVLSATLATPLSAQGIRFFCDGRCRVSVRCWALQK